MKKFFLLFLISGGLFMASCTKQYNSVQPNQTLLADLKPSNWATTDGGLNYSTTINVSALDKFVNSQDGVLVAFTFDNGTSYEELPETYNDVSFTYTYTDGSITLYAQSSDGTKIITAPEALTAKIVLVDSQ